MRWNASFPYEIINVWVVISVNVTISRRLPNTFTSSHTHKLHIPAFDFRKYKRFDFFNKCKRLTVTHVVMFSKLSIYQRKRDRFPEANLQISYRAVWHNVLNVR